MSKGVEKLQLRGNIGISCSIEEAIIKQIPKQVLETEDPNIYQCPACTNKLVRCPVCFYCSWCGQKLDWEKVR